jgi:hypothetical protein
MRYATSDVDRRRTGQRQIADPATDAGDQPTVADQDPISTQKHVREGIFFVTERHLRRMRITSETNIGPMSPAVGSDELPRVVKIRRTGCKRASAHRQGTDKHRVS